MISKVVRVLLVVVGLLGAIALGLALKFWLDIEVVHTTKVAEVGKMMGWEVDGTVRNAEGFFVYAMRTRICSARLEIGPEKVQEFFEANGLNSRALSPAEREQGDFSERYGNPGAFFREPDIEGEWMAPDFVPELEIRGQWTSVVVGRRASDRGKSLAYAIGCPRTTVVNAGGESQGEK